MDSETWKSLAICFKKCWQCVSAALRETPNDPAALTIEYKLSNTEKM